MSILSLAGADFFVIVALCLIVYLARRNVFINDSKNTMFVHLAVTTIALMLLEMLTLVYQHLGDPRFILPYYWANMLGFALSPLLPFLILVFNADRKSRLVQRFLLAVPLLVNAAASFFSFKTGWIFYIDAQGQYFRGDLFLLPTAAAFFYYCLAGMQMLSLKEYDRKEKRLIFTIFLLPALATMLQIIFKELLLIWGCVGISLMLFYIFMLLTQFKYDPVTGIRNRSEFEKEMMNHQKLDRVLLLVFDFNNLKVINDQYGHKAGDEALLLASRIIQRALSRIGKVYRIGGDEFCAICNDVPMEKVNALFAKIDAALDRAVLSTPVKVKLAHGCAYYTKGKDKNLRATFARADQAMYAHKMQSKITSFNR